jgi:hypothetical protein
VNHNMSYATNTMCKKCNQLTLTGEKLACGRILCQQCKARWNCSCETCNDKGNTFVIREGFCKTCLEPTLSAKIDICAKCKTNTEMKNNEQSESMWDWLWSVGSKFTCGPLFVVEQPKEDSKDEKEHELRIVDDQSGMTVTTLNDSRKKLEAGIHSLAVSYNDAMSGLQRTVFSATM